MLYYQSKVSVAFMRMTNKPRKVIRQRPGHDSRLIGSSKRTIMDSVDTYCLGDSYTWFDMDVLFAHYVGK